MQSASHAPEHIPGHILIQGVDYRVPQSRPISDGVLVCWMVGVCEGEESGVVWVLGCVVSGVLSSDC